MTLVTESLNVWAQERPRYEAYRSALEPAIRDALRLQRIPHQRVTARVKDTRSLATKLLRKGYTSYDQVTDKLGARVVVRVPTEVDRAVSAIVERFGGVVDDKRAALELQTFDYRSVHVQVSGMPGDPSFADLACEVQVRTVTEDAWSEMSHFLSYKSVSETPPLHRRSVAALAALFELADMRYEELATQMIQAPGYEAMALLAEIKATHSALGGGDSDEVLSREVIEALLPAYGDQSPGSVADEIESWVNENSGWLAERLRRADQPDASFFLGQPEVLLLAHLLRRGSMQLLPLWGGHFDVDELERLAEDLQSTVPGLG